jgi:hypothetical protein
LRDVAELVPASGHQLFDGLGVSFRFDYVDNPNLVNTDEAAKARFRTWALFSDRGASCTTHS